MVPKILLTLMAASALHAEFLTIEVKMRDMNCPSCSETLGRIFGKMRGVTKTDVSMEKGTVSLELAEQNRVTLEQVWDAIKRVGFTPGDTKVSVRGAVKEGRLAISVIDRTMAIEGRAADGDGVKLLGTVAPPPDPRTPLKIRVD